MLLFCLAAAWRPTACTSVATCHISLTTSGLSPCNPAMNSAICGPIMTSSTANSQKLLARSCQYGASNAEAKALELSDCASSDRSTRSALSWSTSTGSSCTKPANAATAPVASS